MTSTRSAPEPATVPWAADEDAALYERGRPDYPPALTGLLDDQLGLRRGGHIIDVAAGTGKLTRILAAGPASVVAVEPQPGMRRQLHFKVPKAAVVAGMAELLPIRTGTVDAVTVGQAFHWFDVGDASREFHRVLRPGGRLAVVSNQRHEPEAWVRELWQVLRAYEKEAPDAGSNRGWRALLERTGDFGPFSRFELPNHQRFENLADFDARFASVSFVLLLSPERRAALLRHLHAIVAGIDPIVIPLRTVVEIADRA